MRDGPCVKLRVGGQEVQNELTIHFAAVPGDTPTENVPAMSEVQTAIARAKQGEAGGFEDILVRYQRQVLRTAARLLGNREDACDAAQEVFLRLHKYLHRFNEEKKLSPWLYRMTVNVCRDLIRKNRPGWTLSFEEQRDTGALSKLASPENIEAGIDIARQRRMIADAITLLPEKERAALVLRNIEGLETREVARILGSSETTVRSQISMARVKIKKYLDELRKQI